MKFFIDGIVLPFYHFQVHELPVHYINEIGISFLDISLLLLIFWKELTISYIIAISIPASVTIFAA